MIRIYGQNQYSRRDYQTLSDVLMTAANELCENCTAPFCNVCRKHHVKRDLLSAIQYCESKLVGKSVESVNK